MAPTPERTAAVPAPGSADVVTSPPREWHAQAEYTSLRADLAAYHRQHFDRTMAVIAASSLLLSYGLKERNGAMLLVVYALLFYVAYHSTMVSHRILDIAAYLRVFHEADDTHGWESYSARRRGKDWSSPLTFLRIPLPRVAGQSYQLLYLGMGLTCSVLAFLYLHTWHRFLWPALLFVAWTTYNVGVSAELTRRYRTADAERIARWRELRDGSRE